MAGTKDSFSHEKFFHIHKIKHSDYSADKSKALPLQIAPKFLNIGRFFVIKKTTSLAENGVLGHRGN